MSLDSRVRIVLTALAKLEMEVPAARVINPNLCDPQVTGGILQKAKKSGFVTCKPVKRLKYWKITEAGRTALQST